MTEYRLVVGVLGIIFDEDSKAEARRQFDLFVQKSKNARSAKVAKIPAASKQMCSMVVGKAFGQNSRAGSMSNKSLGTCQNLKRTLQCGRERCMFLGGQPEAEVSTARKRCN
jgi:hypothetical protein